MASQKRTIRVVFEDDSAGSDRPPKIRKTAISIHADATNAELAKEIADTFNQSAGIRMEIDGGFKLRPQDTIDVIEPNFIVSARVCAPPSPDVGTDTIDLIEEEIVSDLLDSSSAPPLKQEPIDTKAEHQDMPLDTPDAIERYKIGFITADHAIAHAKGTAKEQTEATNGVLAFDGEMISGNTTLSDLEREAARVLQWSSSDDASMNVDEVPCHHDDFACSCSISQKLEKDGIFDTLHCRFTRDGSDCMLDDCPYSHSKLFDVPDAKSSTCSLCEEDLTSPCHRCVTSKEEFCPLVQNAGCGHLHHAHCLRSESDLRVARCPAGCPVQRFPREAVDFGTSEPHLIIVWDGDKVDRIPIQVDGVAPGAPIILTADKTVELVEAFLEARTTALSNLSLRVHSRDPKTNTVRFTHSALVSVCPLSSHLDQGNRFMPLFPVKAFEAADRQTSMPRSTGSGFKVDLHTSGAPIIACGCVSIRQLLSSSTVTATGTIWLYAVKRTLPTGNGDAEQDKDKKHSAFLDDAAWQPSVEQTPRGMAALLSSLFLFGSSLDPKGDGLRKVLAAAFAVLRFPPAIRTMAALASKKVPRQEEKAALAEVLYQALGAFSSRGPAAIVGRDSRRFETVRILLAYFASAANADSGVPSEPPFEDVPLECELSRKRLRDPVSMNDDNVEWAVAALYQPGGALFRPERVISVNDLSAQDSSIMNLLPSIPALNAPTALLLRVAAIGSAPPAFIATLDSAARDFDAAIRRANQTDLGSHGPLDLKSMDVVPPCIVVDQQGLLAVFTGRGCGASRDVNFFRPTNGGDKEVNVNEVSHALQNVIKARQAEDTWQVDSFDGVVSLSRTPDEAIVLCLDLSESMSAKSGVVGSSNLDNDSDDDACDDEAQEIAARCVESLDYDEILDSGQTPSTCLYFSLINWSVQPRHIYRRFIANVIIQGSLSLTVLTCVGRDF
ncbi:hypothetical protein FB45DRAFT_447877 [Roridomyces roridus]|uniref:Uncharacterized protein n=1 Tax=Roridomyces roridus TaxID=1738132 RepID=A0AAD7FPT0_9AGAR|nr:hypothetical protein FB45DRAFT_447877 [Roridomyces roridus]